MKKNQLIMLTIIAATLICSNVIQLSGWHPSPIYWLHASWLALDVVAIWAIVAIGKIKPHEPERSPLEYGGIFLFLIGATAAYSIGSTAIAKMAAMLNPDSLPVIEAATQLHDWSPERSIIGNLWPFIAAPVLEEIIYRVGVLGSLMMLMKSPWAIFFSAVIFALNHADIYPPEAVAGIFIFGLIAAATYLLLGLRSAILLHLMNNSQEVWRPWLAQNEYLLNAFMIVSIAALAVFIHQLIRHRRLVLR